MPPALAGCRKRHWSAVRDSASAGMAASAAPARRAALASPPGHRASLTAARIASRRIGETADSIGLHWNVRSCGARCVDDGTSHQCLENRHLVGVLRKRRGTGHRGTGRAPRGVFGNPPARQRRFGACGPMRDRRGGAEDHRRRPARAAHVEVEHHGDVGDAASRTNRARPAAGAPNARAAPIAGSTIAVTISPSRRSFSRRTSLDGRNEECLERNDAAGRRRSASSDLRAKRHQRGGGGRRDAPSRIRCWPNIA